ncbi:hypothetical protein [Nitrosomonas communis]|uniref:Uncharacterized protein n=1 Tax=Nitrosomonas communis TaxID=44574 RepID=A0A1H2XM16_9PROT|nr:hypothetical protein [Nitrosomonas communis]SDW93943.1 hypothetical protein SAMN05421882_104025 [Nitrosomonas communis]
MALLKPVPLLTPLIPPLLAPFFFLVLLSSAICAQPVPATKPAAPATTQSTESPPSDESLYELLTTIEETENERTALSEQLKDTSNPADKQQTQKQLQSLDQRLIDLKNSFEETVTGGQGLATLAEKPEEKAPFNWKKELEEIVRPLMDDLTRILHEHQK